MIEDGVLNGPLLAGEILRLHGHPEEREKMEQVIQSMARPKAAQEIVTAGARTGKARQV
jgi:UDP-N-acetylglucosamine:LPS N-acetylglucosamine transferase